MLTFDWSIDCLASLILLLCFLSQSYLPESYPFVHAVKLAMGFLTESALHVSQVALVLMVVTAVKIVLSISLRMDLVIP